MISKFKEGVIVVVVMVALAVGSAYFFIKSPSIRPQPQPKQPPATNSGVKITDAEVQAIYNNLTKFTGMAQNTMPDLVIDHDDSVINAYSQGFDGPVHIYTGIIKFCQSKDEVADVLAHELSHVLLQHDKLNPPGDGDPNYETFLEGNADKFAVYLVMRAGYDVCQAKGVWGRLRLITGDFETNGTHPNYSYRYWQLEFPVCEKSFFDKWTVH